MKISVVIPTYNRADFLPEALASVRRQEHADLEIIVVDDGSSDATADLVRAFDSSIHFVRFEHNRGVSAARNAGLRLATGEAIAFLDSDDVWAPDKLKTQVPLMQDGVDVVWGKTQVLRRDLLSGPFVPYETPFTGVLVGSVLVRRDLFDERRVGSFDERLSHHEDLDWFMRARERSASVVLHNDVVLYYRWHGGNLTRDDRLRFVASRRLFVQVFKQSLDRRRRLGRLETTLPPLYPQTGRVSVIIPVRNQGRYLAEAIESVIAQTRPAHEIIIVDDGSTDNTPQVVRRYAAHVRYLRQPGRGAPAARNHGAALATGDVLAFLDADDVWLPDKLAAQLTVLEVRPEVDIVFCHMEQFVSEDANGLIQEVPAHLRILPGAHASAMVVRRAAFERVGAFNESYVRTDVIDWIARARERTLCSVTLLQALVRRRWHAHNLGRVARHLDGEYARVIKAALDRRRALGASHERGTLGGLALPAVLLSWPHRRAGWDGCIGCTTDGGQSACAVFRAAHLR